MHYYLILYIYICICRLQNKVCLKDLCTCYSFSLAGVSVVHVVTQQICHFTFVIMFCFVDIKNDLETTNPTSCQETIVHFPGFDSFCVKNVRFTSRYLRNL